MTRPRVLFLCTGNTARSQMAEGLLRALAGDRFEAFSAGLEPGRLHPLTARVMRERGIDVSDQYAKGVEAYLGKLDFAYVITLCDSAAQNCPVFPGAGRRLHWSFDDPAAADGSEEERLTKFREVCDAIEARIARWLAAGAPGD